jgi:hypothetical protein
MPEKQIVLPLDADTIKDGIVTKICEAIYERLNSTCNLYGCAYPKFRAQFSVYLELDNFGEIRLDRVSGESESEGEFHDPERIEINGDIPFTPPNVFRRETSQPIPVIVENEDGSMKQESVFYRRERTSRIGRDSAETDL